MRRARRFPTAYEVERVAEELTRSPVRASDLSEALRIDQRHVSRALASLGYQKRALGTRSGWMLRRSRS